MRILYWTPTYLPHIGGLEVFSARLARALWARGHEVRIVTSHWHREDLPDEEERDGVPVHRFPLRQALESRDPRLVLQAQEQIARFKREFSPHVVHLTPSEEPSVLFHLRTVGSYRSKVLVTLHSQVLEEFCSPRTIFGRVLRTADWVTTVSERQLAVLRQLVPEMVGSSSVIPNGLEQPAARPGPPPADSPRVLCVGRLVPQKAFDRSIAAFAMIAERFPAARLVIAGDGPDREALERQARELGVAHRTDFLGWVAPNRMPELMAGASLVLMPSRWEGLPLVAIEAAQMARPVVGTRVDGLLEAVVDGETGVLVDEEDGAALARAIAGLLADPAAAAAMGRAARERALAAFDADRCVDAYEDLYRQLTGEAIHVDV